MSKLLITVSLVALAMLLPPAISDTTTINLAVKGDGVLVHEGTGAVEPATVRLDATGARTFRAAPYSGLDGDGILIVTTESRTLELPVFFSANVLVRQVGSRNVESWDLGVGNDAGSGTLSLAGTDGFLRGPGAMEVFIPAGADHGRYDLAFVASAEVLR